MASETIKDFFKTNSFNIMVSVLSAASMVILSYFSFKQNLRHLEQNLSTGILNTKFRIWHKN